LTYDEAYPDSSTRPNVKRRSLLQTGLASAVTALAAGCVGSVGSNATQSGTSDAPSDTDRSLRVERVETFTHAIRLNELGTSPHADVPTVSGLSDRQRRVVEAAVDGGYETDAPERWLRKFLSSTRYVRDGGRYYRLEGDLPTVRITAEETTESAVDGEIASYETYEEAVTHDGLVMSGLLRMAMDGGETLVYVWSSLGEFLDRYAAVRYRGSVVAVSAERNDPGPPYEVTAERASVSEFADGPVWDVSNESGAVRDVVREAGETEGLFPLDDPPAGLVDGLDAHEYVLLNDTFYTTYVEKRDRLPLSASARFTDASFADGQPKLALELTNEAHRAVSITTGAPPPFGVLSYQATDDPERRWLLWTDAYEESDHVTVEDGEVKKVHSIGLSTELGAGESTGRTFTLRESAADLDPGAYVVEGAVGVDDSPGGSGTFPYRVVFRVVE
jgi:hypothetical protein